jgi:nitronate monooxygenase
MSLEAILGTAWPLIQAPMAGVQDARLALGVNAAGALGSLPAAMLDAAALHRELRALHDAGRPYNVNFFAHRPPTPDADHEARWRALLAPYYAEFGLDLPSPAGGGASRHPFGPEAAEVLEAFRPTLVSFHFGLPEPRLLARVRGLGALVLSSATTVEEALWLQKNGADVVIAQGLEAGGHRGHFLGTDISQHADTANLLPQVVAALDIPVIAAGGIADAAGVRAAMGQGAAAVQVGTAFLLCSEATTGALHRARLRDTTAPTALTNLFSGGLARGLFNRAMRELGPVCDAAPPFPLASGTIAPLRARAEAMGRDDFTPLWSGANRSGCREAPAAEIVRLLAAGFAH